MKCVKINKPKELIVGTAEEPQVDHEHVIIEVKRTGICGSDIHNWAGGEPKSLIMGHEFCGTVIDPGSCLDLQIGDKVTALPLSPCGHCPACLSGNIQYCPNTWTDAVGLSLTSPGGFCPKIAVRPDMVLKVPASVTFDAAALTEPLAVGLHAAHLADIPVGAKVLVIGGGIIGLASAMFAKMEGASQVFLTETNPARGRKSLDLEVCDAWYDATLEETTSKLLTKTNGGFDYVIECVGSSSAVNSAITLAKPGGTVVLVGVATDAIPTLTVMAVMKELTLKGAIAYTKGEFETCLDLIARGKIDAEKFIDDIVHLSKVQSSFERLTSGTDNAIKILVDPQTN